jgi:exocyst complex component 6
MWRWQRESAQSTDRITSATRSSSNSARGGVITLQSGKSFESTLEFAQGRIDSIIASKLDDFFEMAEYDWMPKPTPMPARQGRNSPALGRNSPVPFAPASVNTVAREPSTYLFEMITFLTAYVDSVLIMLSESTKTRTYRNALEHIRAGLMVRPAGPPASAYMN